MPPKGKKEEPKKTLLLGRPGTSLQVGIVGMPNVGKSTFFNVITKSAIPAENFPFCTIDPNSARVIVPDERYDWLVEKFNPKSRDNYPWLQITDIAGLVKGASEGEGLGNAFLSHIYATDGIFMMVRVFDDPEITHVEGEVDPIRDLDIIVSELLLKDKAMIDEKVEKLSAAVKRGLEKHRKKELEILERVQQWITVDKKPVRCGPWNLEDIELLNTLHLLTAKTAVYLCNMSPDDYMKKKNKWLPKIKAWVDEHTPGEMIIPVSAKFEAMLSEMPDDERQKYLKENNASSALPKIVKAGFSALNLQYFFTAGEDEVKAWIIRKGDLAPVAAGRIHSDMQKGFICAEVMHFEDLKECGSEGACRGAGKLRQQGRGYAVEDGDICFFKFNAGAGLKK